MKKFFTMLMASASVICANAATSLSFNVTTVDNFITVNPTDNSASYFAAVLDEYTMNIWSYLGGTVNNPDMLFTLASNVYDTNIFTGSYSFEAEEAGDYVVVAVAAYKDQAEDAIVATDQIFVQTVTIGSTGGNDDPEPSQGDLTFTFQGNKDTFTVTPSDPDQPYYLWVFSQEEVDFYTEEYGSLDAVFALLADGMSEQDILFDATTQSAEDDWYLEDYGTYYVVVSQMEKDGRYYYPIGQTTTFVWEYTNGDNTTALTNLTQTAGKAAKAMIDGRIVLKGRYGLNGAILK